MFLFSFVDLSIPENRPFAKYCIPVRRTFSRKNPKITQRQFQPAEIRMIVVADGEGDIDGVVVAAFFDGPARHGIPALTPFLSPVIDTQHLDALLLHAIDGDIGQGREQQLPCSFFASGTAEIRPLSSAIGSRRTLCAWSRRGGADGGL
jgi:hypothetical protein